jgi:glycosyltransferase involved in cell wall biosynthesis
MLSTYTICSNPLSEYYPIKEMVLSNLQFADEVVVADFDSTDGTLELLNYIQEDIKKNLSKYYGRLKIVIGDTKYENTEYFYTEAKNQALDACTNDWVVRIDADEIIPEWSFEKIKELSTDKKAYAFRFKRLHFYKDYNTIKVIPKDKIGYTYMFRKSTTARHKYVVGNCDGLIKTSNNTFFDDLGIPVDVTVFHYSWCRPVKILLKRMQRIEKKLIPFSELRKKQYPNNYKIEQVNDWFKIDSSLTDEEIEKKIFDMRGTTLYGGKHPLLMYEKIKLGMTVDTTYHKVLEPECKMGISLNNYQDNSKNVNICSDICSIPKISTYISTINSLFYQSTLEQTIRQSLLFSDEIIVVNSSNSSDGT